MRSLSLSLLILSLSFKLHGDDRIPLIVGPDNRTHIVERSTNGEVSTRTYPLKPMAIGTEIKHVDKANDVLQWRQGFLDEKGHETMSITRKSLGNHPSYYGIEEVSVRTYNNSGNVAEQYTYSGDGIFKEHVIYRYDWRGNWVRGDFYDSAGHSQGSTDTEPQAFLYGSRQK